MFETNIFYQNTNIIFFEDSRLSKDYCCKLAKEVIARLKIGCVRRDASHSAVLKSVHLRHVPVIQLH